MQKIILGLIALSLIACNSDDNNSDLISKYNSGNKSEFFKHYWEYVGPYKDSGSDLFFPPNLNLGNGELERGDIIHFGNQYVEYYRVEYNNEEVSNRDLWYDEGGILNILNLQFMVDDKNLETNYQKSFPFMRHETNDTILLLDNGVTYYLLRKENR